MKYLYPALFEKDDNGKFLVDVPDLPGCHTFGNDPYDAVIMARDAMSMWLCSAEDDGDEIPTASSIDAIKAEGGTVALIDVDTDAYRRENDNRAVKKTLSIPSWLNAKAERAGVNFSQILQDALKQRFGDQPK